MTQTHLKRPVHLRVVGAGMVQEHLIITLEAVIEDTVSTPMPGPPGYSVTPLLPGPIGLAFTDGGLTVVSGSTMTLPALHRTSEDETLVPLTDRNPAARLDGGVPRILELVYPRDIPGVVPGAVVALQYSKEYFRLTEITVDG